MMNSRNQEQSISLGVVPDSVIRPLLDHYVEFYFNRVAHEVRNYDHEELEEDGGGTDVIGTTMTDCYENVSPLLEATMKNDEASVFILLLHIKVNLLRGEGEEGNVMMDNNNSNNDQQQGRRRNYTLADYVNAKVLPTQWTPLHFACHHGNETIVRSLLDHNANHSLTDTKGWTPLAIAINAGHGSIVNLLLDVADTKEANNMSTNRSYVTWRDLESRGETLLHIAVKRNDYVIAKTLLERGIDVNIMGGRHRKTALHYASEIGNLQMIQMLVIQYDANIHIPERRDRRTPLHLVATVSSSSPSSYSSGEEDKSIINSSISGSQSTINNNDNPREDRGNERGETSADDTTYTTTRSLIVQLFIDHGANVNERDRYGFTALHIAIAADYEPPTYTPTAKQTDDDASTTATSNSKSIVVKDNLIQRLLQNGSDPTLPNEYGETVLHRAVMEDNELSLRLILDSYDNGVISNTNKTSKRDALLNAQNNEGFTPLHCAVQLEHESMVKILLDEYHADVNIPDIQSHRTPLYIAVQLNNEPMVRLLIRNGASKTISDQYGRTPWDIAATYGFHAVFPLLS